MGQFDNYTNFAESVDSLKDRTIENGENVLEFGMKFLDKALRGIIKTDLILLGAGSGAGKSEAVFHIALHNAKKGKRVLLFALEAERDEVQIRQYYKLLAKRYFNDPFRIEGYVNYPDFYLGRCWPFLERYRSEVDAEMKKITNLEIRYSNSGYTLQNFAIDVESANNPDLIIVDHLHFFELGDEPENKAYKKAIQQIRDTVLEKKIPVILVSQLRKDSSAKFNSIIPTLADFHGSSDIFKVATKGIMFSSAEDLISPKDQNSRPTLVKAVKNRIDGSVKMYVGAMSYNFQTNTYNDDFFLGRLVWEKDLNTNRIVEKFKLENDLPRWAE